MDRTTFRFDIQSLRAVSVILVIFYHFNLTFNSYPIFSGGFIGVDIFFIISGYVISNIILIELEEKKKFDFILFLEKRLRRLVPALYFLLFVIFIISLFLLLPHRLSQLSSDIIFNIFLSSNFYFWETLEQYGAITGIERPLLHTWSLSVEWQFYIFTSLVFVLFKNKISKNFNLYFVILFIISFVLNLFILNNQINFNFYFSGSRYWEFILGILIRYNQDIIKKLTNKLLNEKLINYILFISFLIIILFSISYQFIENQRIFFILSMLSASILIIFGNTNTYFSQLLDSKTLIFIGGISYSLYIWHYPIASFFYITEYQHHFTNFIKLIMLLPLVLVSFFSYNFIENTFRKISMINSKNFFVLFIFSSLFLVVLSSVTIKNDGFESRLKISENQKKFIVNYNENRKDPIYFPVKINDAKKTILILGNSHGGEYFHLIQNTNYLTEKYNIIYSLIQIRCLKNFMNNINKSNCFRKLEFYKENNFHEKMSLLDKVDIIILKTKWSDQDLKVLPKVIKFFKDKKKIILVGSANPMFNIIGHETFDPNKNYDNEILVHSLFQKNTLLDKYYIKNSSLPKDNNLIDMEKKYFQLVNWKRYEEVNKTLKKISNENKVIFLDDMDVFCDLLSKRCDVLAGETKIHWDEKGHTTFKSKSYLSDKLIQNTKLMDYL